MGRSLHCSTSSDGFLLPALGQGDPAGTKLAPLDSKKLTVMAWNGTAWRTRAHGAFGDGTLHTSLAFNANGTPFVAFNCEPLFRRQAPPGAVAATTWCTHHCCG